MPAYSVVALLILVALAGVGTVTITTGWVPPFGRSRVLRPRLWGSGAVLISLGMAVFLFLGPFQGPTAHPNPFAWAGLFVSFLGSALQLLARRPGHPAIR